MSRHPESEWFWDHYDGAAVQVIDFFAGDGLDLAGKAVADVGCGDGLTDLGLVRKARPERLTGFDLNPVDLMLLRERCAREQVDPELDQALEFATCSPTELPAPDESFDVVLTWSAFEHVAEPISVLSEIRRVLRPGGILFLQLWPFYFSDRGSHLWHWFDDPFPHLTRGEHEIAGVMGADDDPDARRMFEEFRTLNRITVDELQQAMLAAGLGVRKLQLMTDPVHIPPTLMRYPLSQLGISGVKLLAVPLR